MNLKELIRTENLRFTRGIAADSYRDSNISLRTISSVLITIAIGAFLITAPFLNDSSFIQDNISARLLIYLSWIALSISVGFGITQYYIDHKFYIKFAKDYDRLSKLYLVAEKLPEDKDVSNITKDINSSSPVWGHTLQLTFIAIGFALLFSAVTLVWF